MRVLVVGAGAVGQTYGYHLAQGGAEVTFYVREKVVEACRQGFTLYQLGLMSKPKTKRWDDFSLVTSPEQVAESGPWDQVWLCVSSPALQGGWVEQLVAAAGEAAVVSWQPNLRDRDLLLGYVAEDRLISGVITVVAYQAPLPGEERFSEPGIAFWLPPGTPNVLSGPAEHVQAAVTALREGGCPARSHRFAPGWAAGPSAAMMPHLIALEAEDWSLAKLRKSSLLPLAAKASRQAMVVAGKATGVNLWRRTLVRPPLVRLGLCVSAGFAPFDFERYIQFHFTKVGEQTRQMMSTYIELGAEYNEPTDALAQLLERVH